VKIPPRVVVKTGILDSAMDAKRVLYHFTQTEWQEEPEGVAIHIGDLKNVEGLVEEYLKSLELDGRVRDRATRYAKKILAEAEGR